MLQALAKAQAGHADVSLAEASFYLDESEGDVEAARRALIADLEWERSGGRTTVEAVIAASALLPQTLRLLSAA